MLEDIENISITYLSYTEKDDLCWSTRYHKYSQNYFGGLYRIFLDHYYVDFSFLMGVLDSRRHRFLYTNPQYYSELLMYYCQYRHENKLIRHMETHGIEKVPSYRIKRWADEDRYSYLNEQADNCIELGNFFKE